MRLNFLTPPPIPDKLPPNLQLEVDKLKRLPDQSAVLQAAYNLLTHKYRGYHLRTLTQLPDIFQVDVDKLWAKNGFLHCTSMNYLLAILLIDSGHFQPQDLHFRWTLIHYYSPHQYMRVVLTNGQPVDVDLWGKIFGIRFGDHAHGLRSGSLKAVA